MRENPWKNPKNISLNSAEQKNGTEYPRHLKKSTSRTTLGKNVATLIAFAQIPTFFRTVVFAISELVKKWYASFNVFFIFWGLGSVIQGSALARGMLFVQQVSVVAGGQAVWL